MDDVLSPYTVPSPPPPSSSSLPNSKMPMLYYGLVVVGTAAVVLAIYNLIIIRRCSRRQMQPRPPGPEELRVEVETSRSFQGNSNRNFLSSFKYKKEEQRESVQGHEELLEGTVEYECPICLSVFEEGEEVRKLPRCKHCYHVICIDMWLYSHFDCPVCRTPVGPSCQRVPANNNDAAAENSREGLLESGMSS